MAQCKKCKQFMSVTKDDGNIMKCKGCEAVFHKKCGAMNKQFVQTEICEDCQKQKTAAMQKNKNSPKPHEGETKLQFNVAETSGEKVLAEVNKKLEVLYNVNKKVEELSNAVDFYADMYEKLMAFKDESQKKYKSLEQKCLYLEKYNKALEERIQDLEQSDKAKNIEIHGLEMQANENTTKVIRTLAENLNLDPNDIDDAQRVGVQKPDDTKPKIVLVTLRTKSARHSWMAARKYNKITNKKIYSNGNDERIFINEDLPKYKRQLLWTVRNKLKPKGFQYIWVQNGNILVKKNSEERKIYNIKSENDLAKFDETEDRQNTR
ncbi:hypothetical protein O0L34_g8590 [Tuta absoluta]|nr:hypothetical protein O0L34_g8590 [Tuta absoluta]